MFCRFQSVCCENYFLEITYPAPAINANNAVINTIKALSVVVPVAGSTDGKVISYAFESPSIRLLLRSFKSSRRLFVVSSVSVVIVSAHVWLVPVFAVGPVTGSVEGVFVVVSILLASPHPPEDFVINPKLLFSETSPAARVIASSLVNPFGVQSFVPACTESD